jgi:cytochrome P450
MTQTHDTASRSALRYSVQDVSSVPKASFWDTLAIVGDVLFPTLSKGVIIRRPTVMALAERLDVDRRAIRRMQRIRNKYGSGPLVLRFPGRSLALILDPEHVHRVLAQSPEPFATASIEKRAALAHFEPKNVLISHGPERAERRRYNEEALDSNHPVHRLAECFLNVVASEATYLHESVHRRGELNWEEFSRAWFRIVRRVVFGDAAREDHQLSKMMFQLRSAANWAFLVPQRKDLRQQLLDRIKSYLSRPDPASLAGVMAQTHSTSRTAPEDQVPQWLFAFDPAGMTTFRTLALLASHPEYARHVREEIGSPHGAAREYLPYTRAAVLESLRLWPTTPFVLRESTAATAWETGILPANTGILIYTPFFHRDDQHLPYADQFSPDLWRNAQPQGWPLIPFSEGPAMCPGRHLVLLLSTAMLAAILERARVRLKHPTRLIAGQPLPATLNHFGLRFELKSLG